MSSETLEKARVAARAFGKDVSELNLTALIDSIIAHRQAEQDDPTPEPEPVETQEAAPAE